MDTKKLKKGEKLFDEKDNVDKVFLIKSGKMLIYLERNGKRIELGYALTGQVLSEKSIFAPGKVGYCAMAHQETTVLEVPHTELKPHLEGGQPVMKMLLKGVSDRILEMQKTIQGLKLESDNIPCSERAVARVFGIIALYANQAGQKDEKAPGVLTVSWNAMKMYATRMFLESPVRLQQAIELLTKLKYAEMIYKHDEIEDEDVLSDIKILNAAFINEFADFYQYNYYKGGASEILKLDETTVKVLRYLNDVCKDIEPDRKGVVDTPYEKVAQNIKAKYRLDIKPMHFDMLEKKGLFANRKPRDEGMYLQFDKKEFDRVYKFWQIIKEIDKWNELGFINMKEDEEKSVTQIPTACPECGTETQGGFKFCANCGFKLAA